jgi:hypothetical protein
MYDGRRLIGAVAKVPLGGAVVAVDADEYLDEEVEGIIFCSLLTNGPAAADRVGILEVYPEEAQVRFAL